MKAIQARVRDTNDEQTQPLPKPITKETDIRSKKSKTFSKIAPKPLFSNDPCHVTLQKNTPVPPSGSTLPNQSSMPSQGPFIILLPPDSVPKVSYTLPEIAFKPSQEPLSIIQENPLPSSFSNISAAQHSNTVSACARASPYTFSVAFPSLTPSTTPGTARHEYPGIDKKSKLYRRYHRGPKYYEKHKQSYPRKEHRDHVCSKCLKQKAGHPCKGGYTFCKETSNIPYEDWLKEIEEMIEKKKESRQTYY